MANTPKNIDFGHYMALGMVWYGAKYSHGVWERFAHHSENFKKSRKIQFWKRKNEKTNVRVSETLFLNM